MHAECCGEEVTYSSGLFGADMAQCKQCGAQVRNVLSPHCSPVLLGNNFTRVPSDHFIDQMTGHEWCAKKGG